MFPVSNLTLESSKNDSDVEMKPADSKGAKTSPSQMAPGAPNETAQILSNLKIEDNSSNFEAKLRN